MPAHGSAGRFHAWLGILMIVMGTQVDIRASEGVAACPKGSCWYEFLCIAGLTIAATSMLSGCAGGVAGFSGLMPGVVAMAKCGRRCSRQRVQPAVASGALLNRQRGAFAEASARPVHQKVPCSVAQRFTIPTAHNLTIDSDVASRQFPLHDPHATQSCREAVLCFARTQMVASQLEHLRYT